MGKITVDDEPRTYSLDGAPTVANVFEKVRDDILDQGRIVVQVLLDGTLIEWNDGSPHWSMSFVDPMELQVKTDLPLALSSALLGRAIESLPDLVTLHERAAAAIRGADQEGGVEMTLALLGTWRELQEAIVSVCALHKIDFESEHWKSFGEELGPALRRVSEQIGELKEAFELRDFILVGDLLAYELAPMASAWETVCTRLLDLLGKENAG